eukprot:1951848-Pleurochrysis_carterae.AAC.1
MCRNALYACSVAHACGRAHVHARAHAHTHAHTLAHLYTSAAPTFSFLKLHDSMPSRASPCMFDDLSGLTSIDSRVYLAATMLGAAPNCAFCVYVGRWRIRSEARAEGCQDGAEAALAAAADGGVERQ